MVSHRTAPLKLTPWHGGTFASAVIYSSLSCPLPPPRVSPPPPLPPRNDIHYFIVNQESFFSRRLRAERGGKGVKTRCGDWRVAAVTPAPRWEKAACCSAEAGTSEALWGNTAASTRNRPPGQDVIACQGFSALAHVLQTSGRRSSENKGINVGTFQVGTP